MLVLNVSSLQILDLSSPTSFNKPLF